MVKIITPMAAIGIVDRGVTIFIFLVLDSIIVWFSILNKIIVITNPVSIVFFFLGVFSCVFIIAQ